MEVTGGCFCGAIAYAARLDPTAVGICHCRDCQIFSGSAFRMTGIIDPEHFCFTAGLPSYFDKVAESGSVRRMAFCAICGTHLCSVPPEPERAGGFVSLRVSTCDQFSEITPSMEIFCDSRVNWLAPLDGLMQFSKMPG